MKKDKYGVKIKVGDFVLLDTMQGAEYPNMNSGQMVQIKKIGSKRIYYDRGMTNLYQANFEHITAHKAVGIKKVKYEYLLMVRKATNRQVLRYEFKKLPCDGINGRTDKELRRSLLKNELWAYKNKDAKYAMENKVWSPTFASNIDQDSIKHLKLLEKKDYA